MTNYAVLDLETTMSEKGPKGKSDPFYDRILTIGLKYYARVYPNTSNSDINGIGWMNKTTHALAQDYMPEGWLDGIDLIIGHNLAFDLQFIWRNDELQQFFIRGGRIWDTQLVEYILSGQRHKYPALRDIAVNKYGCAERVKHIEGRNTEEVPIELLLEDVQNDVLDTEQVALQQLKLVKQEGMLGLIYTQMDARLATIEMEFNGFKVSNETLEANQKELEEKLMPLIQDIEKRAEKHWFIGQKININSPKQLQTLFFGGSIKGKEKIEDGLYKNGNQKYKTIDVEYTIPGLGLKPHKDWKTPSGGISVSEKVLKAIARLK